MAAAAATCINMSTPTPVGVVPGKAPEPPSPRSNRSGSNDSSRTPRAIRRKRTVGLSARRRTTAKTTVAPSVPTAVKKTVGPGSARGGKSLGMSRVAKAAWRTASAAMIDPTSALSPRTHSLSFRAISMVSEKVVLSENVALGLKSHNRRARPRSIARFHVRTRPRLGARFRVFTRPPWAKTTEP